MPSSPEKMNAMQRSKSRRYNEMQQLQNLILGPKDIQKRYLQDAFQRDSSSPHNEYAYPQSMSQQAMNMIASDSPLTMPSNTSMDS